MPETRLMTINEICPILRCKPITIRRLIHAGELPYAKIGRRYCFNDEHIKTFIARNEGNMKTGEGRETP
jgi:excisionase family DNA binding protein